MIKEVTKFQTTDGKCFDTLEEAEMYEKNKAIDSELAQFVEKHMYRGISTDVIYEILCENKDELLSILQK